ncbi:MAG: hypothetical protein F6K50_15185 [Moorea sp. SIO3I7]|uniref:hypothetical protein n=1 Tax=unclassified Moorena TaxID=2683338 RepID=UPI0013BF1680|nr:MULTISPECIES: hypothetical protein [unclassified Moorena]NEN96824.1 hypothetical protein [Moorena sp. SIO3I7]NEO05190.1 hypothetical protein [Moorena sp. SIO3I8]NEO46529.1 hypothetical protein [Moorena sp. SIO4A3]NEP25936.1 hypothetical protein [Moorena sp. SIO3I6]
MSNILMRSAIYSVYYSKEVHSIFYLLHFPCSLLPAPCSLKPRTKVHHEFYYCYKL